MKALAGKNRGNVAKKVLMLVENLPVPFDRRVWMEATALAQAGYTVAIIGPKGSYAHWQETINDIRIYRYPLPSLSGIIGHLLEYSIALLATFLLTCYVYWRHGFDVIQSANPPDFFFLIAGLFKRVGTKFVFDHHDLVPETCETRWTGAKLRVMRTVSLWAEKATYQTADRVIATNESYREIAIKRGGVPPEQVVIVRSGPSQTKFGPVSPRLELKNGRRYLVCYLGVMGPNDGIDYLLDSIRIIVKEMSRSDIQFVLMGGGDLQPAMVELSHTLGLGDFVRFTGRIPDAEVIEWLSTADLCVAPDPKDPLNDVSTMNKIVEYMAVGKALVAFDLREARVSAGEAAHYATANDTADFAAKITALLACSEERQRMSTIARQRFEAELAWEHQRTKLIAMYRELIG